MKNGIKISRKTLAELAQFRYELRKFLRFSESAARQSGVTPQQHQLLLGVAGFTGSGTATISELAEFLQEKNNSVVGLVARAVQSGFVRRQTSPTDRRTVVVSLTERGRKILSALTVIHGEEVKRLRTGLLNGSKRQPLAPKSGQQNTAQPKPSAPGKRIRER